MFSPSGVLQTEFIDPVEIQDPRVYKLEKGRWQILTLKSDNLTMTIEETKNQYPKEGDQLLAEYATNHLSKKKNANKKKCKNSGMRLSLNQ